MSMKLEEMMQKIKEQEKNLVFDSFDNDTAWELGCLFEKRAKEKNYAITISIRLASGFNVFQRARIGAILNNETWLTAKHDTVILRNMSTLCLNCFMNLKNKTYEDMKMLGNYTNYGGGFPLSVKGIGVIGSILISGLYHIDDHNFIVEVLGEFLDKEYELITE